MENALEIRNLSKSYGDFVLQDINLTLPSGCIMGFIGENGAGKTTTIRLILDLIRRDSGEIFLLGRDNRSDFSPVLEHVGVVFDESCFPEALSAGSVNGVMKHIYRTWDEQKYQDLCGRFSLPMKKSVKEYSRGMKMKLGFAVALSHDARLLILDEATSGLDPIARDEILDLLLDFIQDETHSVFISSHIISDLEKISDYIAFIHRGKLLFCEEKDALRSKYALIRCSAEELDNLGPGAVVGQRRGAFGAEALVIRDKIPQGLATEPAGVEDIMVYMVKESRK